MSRHKGLIDFAPGDPRTAALGRKGGQVSAAARRKSRVPYRGTVLDVMTRAGLCGPSWGSWRVILSATFGLPVSPHDRAFFSDHTARTDPPSTPVLESWIVAGRRAGKSRLAALVAFYKAITFDPAGLAPGEFAVVPIIAADRKQARVILSYLKALCDLDQFRPYVFRTLKEAIEFRTGVNLEVHAASYRTIRGYTIPAAVLDEVAFWRDETTSTNPDSEILDALRPGMATVLDALLFAISSPYARRGELFRTYERYYGQDNQQVLVWNADTRSLNPNVTEHVVARAYDEDHVAAASEYGSDGHVSFRRDIESFVDHDAVDAVTIHERFELPFVQGRPYVGFVDPSGGSQDSFTIAIAHREREDLAILDCLRERRPPFSPDLVVREFAELVKSYGIQSVYGDRYAGEWPREAFRRNGITYIPSERVKSELYRELLAPLNAGRIELLDISALRAQMVALERRVARGGRDSIDHPPGARDDLANAAAGALVGVLPKVQPRQRTACVWPSHA